jgi:hypothetical protein
MINHIRDKVKNSGMRYRQLVALFAMVLASYVTLSGCSSDSKKDEGSSQGGSSGSSSSTDSATGSQGGQGGTAGNLSTQTASASRGTTRSASAGAGGTATTANAGGKAGSQTTSTAGAGSGGQATNDAGTKADCTAVKWDNPGKVPDPKVEAIAADAGKGYPFGRFKDIAKFDYVEEEFFFSGTTPASYTSRILVRRPKDPAKFSGTVFAEWLNVSGQIDFATEWTYSREYFMRAGHVHVSVSAQQVGADALKNTCDSERYARISHPGDTYANAIFSQAGAAVRLQTKLVLGDCMPVHAVIAIGQSQSAMRLADYINNAQANDKVYDGIVPHSGAEPTSNNTPVPVFIVTTLTEGNMSLTPAKNLAKWVLAGATHSDVYETTRGLEVAADIGMDATPQKCTYPGNTYPSWRVYNAVWDWMHRWVRKGEKPPEAPLLTGKNDEYGNTLGGVRLPEIDVPTATYSTANSAADPFDMVSAMACVFMGAATPFTEQQLLQLYPTHDDYVNKYTAAADKALAAGYLLKPEYDDAIKEAKAAAIPK